LPSMLIKWVQQEELNMPVTVLPTWRGAKFEEPHSMTPRKRQSDLSQKYYSIKDRP